MHRLLRYFLLIVVCLSSNIVISQSPDPSSNFLRFVAGKEEWKGELQTTIATYKNESDITVDLVSAVHLGELEYYAELNNYFRQQDVVLYELIAYEDDRPTPEAVLKNASTISFMQRSLGNFLGLSFQLEQIDYSSVNFVHADLNPDELQQIMLEKNENFFSMFLSLAVAQLASEQGAIEQGEAPTSFTMLSILNALTAEDQTAAFKYLIAEELGHTEGMIIGSELEDKITILGDRNRAALEVLEQTLKNPVKQKVSIFYGAAHMPGIERALITYFGFKKIGQRWLNAWEMP